MKTDKKRQEALLKILHYIQAGGDLEHAKKMFQDNFEQVDASEIAAAERELIAQGLDPRQIQYLCNIHAETFKGHLTENKENPAFEEPGHPVQTFKQENLVIKSLINDYLLPKLKIWEQEHNSQTLKQIQAALNDLMTIDKHYARKETSLFPIMNKHGITAPPEVMWGVDNQIRQLIKLAQKSAQRIPVNQDQLADAIHSAASEVLEMIFKEEKIMLPIIMEVASPKEWKNVKDEEAQFGYTLIQKPMNWQPHVAESAQSIIEFEQLSSLYVNFKEGRLNIEQLSLILDLLPFDLTFVDEHDRVAFFGGGAHLYPHSKNALGNSVYSCHTAESRPIVKKVFTLLKTGQKNMVEYWFTPKKMGKTLYLRYYALRNKANHYLGVIEVAEDITNIQNLTGKKKELSY